MFLIYGLTRSSHGYLLMKTWYVYWKFSERIITYSLENLNGYGGYPQRVPGTVFLEENPCIIIHLHIPVTVPSSHWCSVNICIMTGSITPSVEGNGGPVRYWTVNTWESSTKSPKEYSKWSFIYRLNWDHRYKQVSEWLSFCLQLLSTPRLSGLLDSSNLAFGGAPHIQSPTILFVPSLSSSSHP